MAKITIAMITGEYDTILSIWLNLLYESISCIRKTIDGVPTIYIFEPQSTQIKYKTIEDILSNYDKKDYKIQFKKCEIDV